MFDGIDDIDWASMKHAYGPAADTPDQLWLLLADDPEVQEMALDHLRGSLHHQDVDVYDSTVAALPYFFEVLDQSTDGRAGLVELLHSIFQAGIGVDNISADNGTAGNGTAEEESELEPYRVARTLILQRSELLLDLLNDPSPATREVAARAVADIYRGSLVAITCLQERLSGERDPAVRVAMIGAVGTLSSAENGDTTAIVKWLDTLTDSADRLAALAQLVRHHPARAPTVTAEMIANLIDDLPLQEPEVPASGNTMASHVRNLFVVPQSRMPLWARDLVADLTESLGVRVADRVSLTLSRMGRADPGERMDGVHAAARLMREWRGTPDGYDGLIVRCGDLLFDPEPKVASGAMHALKYLGPMGLAASDRLLELDRQATAPGDLSEAAQALARMGDPRILPTLFAVAPAASEAWGWAVRDLGETARPLVGELVDLLARAGELDDVTVGSLLSAAVSLAPVEALPTMMAEVGRAGSVRHWRTASAIRALARIGSPDVLPTVVPFLDSANPELVSAALECVARLSEPDEITLEHAASLLDSPQPALAFGAIEVWGAAAAVLAPQVVTLLDHHNEWVSAPAAIAYWRLTGDTEAGLDRLLKAWQLPRQRLRVARAFVDHIGADAVRFRSVLATAVSQLAQTELEHPRRHLATDSVGYSHAVIEDEVLLKLSRTLVARFA